MDPSYNFGSHLEFGFDVKADDMCMHQECKIKGLLLTHWDLLWRVMQAPKWSETGLREQGKKTGSVFIVIMDEGSHTG